MIYRLQRSQILGVALSGAWSFFSSPGNLRRITPPWLDFQVVSDIPPVMYAGQIIRYRIRPVLAIPLQWVTEITHVKEPLFFVDEQRFGPYQFWHHQHRFTKTPEGVRMDDTVHYMLKGGLIGRMIHPRFVRPKLEAIFDHRRNVLERIFPVRPVPDSS
jgi:ligand-binding SRPBCC domain-containing protein